MGTDLWQCTYSCWLYNAAPLGDQAANYVIWCPTQSYYPHTESTSHCPIPIMLSAWLRRDGYQYLVHKVDSTDKQTPVSCTRGSRSIGFGHRARCPYIYTHIYIHIYIYTYIYTYIYVYISAKKSVANTGNSRTQLGPVVYAAHTLRGPDWLIFPTQ